MHIYVLKKRSFFIFFLIFFSIISASILFYLNSSKTVTTFNQSEKGHAREIHLVTGEFKAKKEDGQEIEAYRWDPGTIFVNKNEKVILRILGVNGREHPFIIEGTTIEGVVKQGEESVIEVQFNKEGVYRLVCLTHPDKHSNGPMIAYIVVD